MTLRWGLGAKRISPVSGELSSWALALTAFDGGLSRERGLLVPKVGRFTGSEARIAELGGWCGSSFTTRNDRYVHGSIAYMPIHGYWVDLSARSSVELCSSTSETNTATRGVRAATRVEFRGYSSSFEYAQSTREPRQPALSSSAVLS